MDSLTPQTRDKLADIAAARKRREKGFDRAKLKQMQRIDPYAMEKRDRKECVALYQKVLDSEKEAAAAANVSGDQAMAQVYSFLGRFVSYPNEHSHVAHALWCVHAHLMDRWESTPRLAFLSAEPASGKTRALEITELLVPNPVQAVNVSPSYLFRKVGREEGATILYDEIDTVFGPKARENEELRGLLNAGHRKGAVAGRCVIRGKEIETEEIPAYAAVAMAGLGWLPDTILSRSVIVRMRRRHAGESVEPYRRRLHYSQGDSIRQSIAAWARSVDIRWPELPAGIEDRNANVWEPSLPLPTRSAEIGRSGPGMPHWRWWRRLRRSSRV
jgi:Protein of unknown function (DUF3631)